jgi:hypothetical protein
LAVLVFATAAWWLRPVPTSVELLRVSSPPPTCCDWITDGLGYTGPTPPPTMFWLTGDHSALTTYTVEYDMDWYVCVPDAGRVYFRPRLRTQEAKR